MRTKDLRWLIPAVLLYGIGFTAAAFWDLTITSTLYTPGRLPAILMEALGWYPIFVPPMLLAMLWLTGGKNTSVPSVFRIFSGFVVAGGFAAIYYKSGRYLTKRAIISGMGFTTLIWLAAGILFAIACLLAVYRLTAARNKLVFFAFTGTLFFISIQAVAYLLKFIWARTRFDDMLAAGSFADFTPWYHPFGNGGSSFPSGHTVSAAGIFVILLLCDLFPRLQKYRTAFTAACWCYIALMAYSRMQIGRHFLSDTLAASAIAALLFFAIHRSRFYQNALHSILQTKAKAATPPKGNNNEL